MKKEEVKKWVEDHKSEIKTAVKIVAGVTIAIVIGKKLKSNHVASETTKTITYSPKMPDIGRELPAELVDMGFSVFSNDKNYIEYADYGEMVPELAIEDMHKAVDAIKDIPGFNPDKTRIQAMFNVYKLDE